MSDDLWLALARFAAACAGSVLLAAILGALLRRLAVRWPALSAHRSVWLSAQLAIVLGLVLAIAPIPRGAVTPMLQLPAAMSDAASGAPAGAGVGSGQADVDSATFTAKAVDLALRWLPGAWLAVYLAGLAWHGARRLRAALHWRALMRRHARILDAAEFPCPALTPRQRARIADAGLTVYTIDLPVSPMLHGVVRPGLLLPTHLATLDADQQGLIVEHELTHWRRADPAWLALSGMLALACWFSRPMGRMHEALREAVELGCDDAVLAGRSGNERRSYAAALVAQLRLQLQCQAHGAPAFGSVGVAGRVQRMRSKNAARLGAPARTLTGAGLLGFALAGAALQPAFSHAPIQPAAPVALTPWVAPQVHETWRWPLATPRVTSLYGVRSPSRPLGHKGIDLAARRGTPVHAVAAGSVAEAGFEPAWGHHVRVDHGGGRSSLLIHLERIDVKVGQRVNAGDPLGTSGASGKATGPHLHLEYWQDGQRRDPALVLPDLLERSTAKAIARRTAQGNPVPTDL